MALERGGGHVRPSFARGLGWGMSWGVLVLEISWELVIRSTILGGGQVVAPGALLGIWWADDLLVSRRRWREYAQASSSKMLCKWVVSPTPNPLHYMTSSANTPNTTRKLWY